jgi:hypothetical protein
MNIDRVFRIQSNILPSSRGLLTFQSLAVTLCTLLQVLTLNKAGNVSKT